MSPSNPPTDRPPAAAPIARQKRRGRIGCAVGGLLAVAFFLTDFRLRPPRLPEVIELEFTVPASPESSREPLITTGAFERGDFLYVSYLDAETLTFGYDSWGAGGPQSPAIKVKPGQTLSLRITLPALVNLTTGKQTPELAVAVTDGIAWRAKVTFHDCSPATIQWAGNRIGGSSCSGSLSGVLRRPDGHRVAGLGPGCYYSLRERLALWRHEMGWLAAAYMIGAAGLAWLGVAVLPWPAILGRLRRHLILLAWHPVPESVPEKKPESARGPDEACAWLHWIPAKPFILGFAVGFAFCVGAGFLAGRQVMFRSFVRFFQPIQPQTLYYPTARELSAYVEGTVPPDKILVLVGGASYFRGTGQNPGELWTHELQRLLGERYAVVNFAIDQAGTPAFAGVVYQILAKKYSRMVYVSSGGAFSEDSLDGGEVYQYLYWDAYYKGMLTLEAPWQERVKKEIGRQLRTDAGQELHLGKRLDALTYACDLWSWVGYNCFFTVWSDSYPHHPFRARSRYIESDDPHLAQHQQQSQSDADLIKLYEKRYLDFSRTGYVQATDGQWQLAPHTLASIAEHYDRMLPPAVRSRSLVVLLHGNPYFMRTLSADDRRRLIDTSALAQGVIEKLGYQAVQAGADFPPEDFVDAGHFLASGGRKIARIVADKIVDMKL